MPISFDKIQKGGAYGRNTLADRWGYSSFHALARGVVTPKEDNKIVLFVTEQKQDSAAQYVDKLSGNILDWEGPTDHFAEERMVASQSSGEEIHLFYRERHHSDFIYCGRLKVVSHDLKLDRPSRFRFQIL